MTAVFFTKKFVAISGDDIEQQSVMSCGSGNGINKLDAI
jgi:hypothetical protein